MESWHQSKLININSLVCVYVNLLIIVYNNFQFSQAFQNKLYKSEDIFANQDAIIHEAQLCRVCDYSDAI